MDDLHSTDPLASTHSSATEQIPEPELHLHSSAAPSTIFFGRFGMRAGWGIAIFIFLSLIVISISGLMGVAAAGQLKAIQHAQAYAQAHPGQPEPHVQRDLLPIFPLVNDGVQFLLTLGICWFFSKAERRPLSVYGLGSQRLYDLIPGSIWGLTMMTALVVLLHLGGWLGFNGMNVDGGTAIVYGLKWLLAFLAVGFAEEYLLRGYLQYTLMRGFWGLGERLSPRAPFNIAFWLAAIITSTIFALLHTGNNGETAFGIIQVFIAGMVFSFALWRTGSLWWSVGFHAIWDWSQSFLYGVADSGNLSVGRLLNTHPSGPTLLSGGPTGPEGSIFGTVALLCTLAAIMIAPAGPEPSPEPEPQLHTGKFHNIAT